MQNEIEVLDMFHVEELEKRYEMGWIKKTEVEYKYNDKTGHTVGGKITL